ncbi:MAG TPA: cell division protein SepF [Pseudonocardiaceae bacterium]|nr:cell division protein SepF [Pseudonocardiaceae bacterium]
MSALYRLKAYFGMVPAEEFDDYYPDYHPNSRSGYDSGYGQGYDDADYDIAASHPSRERDYAATRSGASRPHRADFGGYDDGVTAQRGRPAAPRMHPSRSPSWATEAPVHGALAIDTTPTVAPPAASASPKLAGHPLASDPFADPFADDQGYPLSRIVTLHPHNYNEARPIGERYREGNPVIMNLTEMEDRDAKRLVDFAAGLAFALRGSIDKVTNKVFLLSPPNVDVSAEDKRRIAEGRLFG